MFKILGKWENIRIWGLLKINMKWIISRQLPDNKKRVPLIPIADWLVYVYIFSTLIYFLSKSTSFPPRNNRNAPLKDFLLPKRR